MGSDVASRFPESIPFLRTRLHLSTLRKETHSSVVLRRYHRKAGASLHAAHGFPVHADDRKRVICRVNRDVRTPPSYLKKAAVFDVTRTRIGPRKMPILPLIGTHLRVMLKQLPRRRIV